MSAFGKLSSLSTYGSFVLHSVFSVVDLYGTENTSTAALGEARGLPRPEAGLQPWPVKRTSTW